MFNTQIYIFLLSCTWPDPDIWEAGTSINTIALVFVDESAKLVANSFPIVAAQIVLFCYFLQTRH